MRGGVGLFSLLFYFTGFFRKVQWNVVDGFILLLFIYSIVRLFFQEIISQSAWVQLTFLAGSYGVTRILWSSIDKKSLQYILIALLLAGIAEAVYGLGQLYGIWPSHHHLFLLTGTFFNPGPYSGWMACLVPVAVYGIMQNNKRAKAHPWVNYLSWTYLLMSVLVLVPASSRAALLAATAGGVAVSWPRIKNSSLWQSTWFKVALPSLVVIGLVCLYLMKTDSADGRILIYKVTTDMIADAPFCGFGWNSFPMMYNNYQAVYFENGHGNEREEYLADHVVFGFNEFLEFTAEMGMVGLLFLAGSIILLIRKWRERTKKQNIQPFHYLGISVLLAWSVFALFSYPMSVPALVIILPVSLSGLNTAFDIFKSNTDPIYINPISKNLPINFITGIILVLLSVYSIYWVLYFRPLTQEWMVANANQELQHYEIANNLYNTLYPEFRSEGLFLQYAGKSHSINRTFYASEQLLERALLFSADPAIFTTLGKDYTLFSKVDSLKKLRAEILLTRAKYISPSKHYPRYLLTKYYQSIGEKEKSWNEAKALLTTKSKVTSAASAEIKVEMQQLIDQKLYDNQKIILPASSPEVEK